VIHPMYAVAFRNPLGSMHALQARSPSQLDETHENRFRLVVSMMRNKEVVDAVMSARLSEGSIAEAASIGFEAAGRACIGVIVSRPSQGNDGRGNVD